MSMVLQHLKTLALVLKIRSMSAIGTLIIHAIFILISPREFKRVSMCETAK